MNIIVFCDNEKIINSLNFINNISIFTHTFNEKDKLILFSLSKYLITNNININFSNNFKNINLSYNINKYYHLEKIFIPFEYINNINYSSKFIILDNYLDNYYFENNFLISYNNSYIINENNLYIINHQNKINNENIYNKLYITHNYLSKLTINYQYIFEPKLIFTNNIKIIKFKNKDLFNYGIVEYNNNYYYKIFNHYSLINLDDIILNLPIDFNFIYVEEKFENIICTNNFLNLKINLIFMINKDNLKNSEYNIRTLLNQSYNNYNIIIFLNNIVSDRFSNMNENNNVFIFKSTDNKLNIDIILFLIKLSDNNSLISIIDNTYLLHPNFSLNYINMLFISKKLLLTDIYSNKYLNLLIFKKELFIFILNDCIYNILKNNDSNYLLYLYNIFKKINSNHFYLKNYVFDINFDIHLNIELNNKIFDNNLYLYLETNQLNFFYAYLSISFNNYSKKKISLLFDKNTNLDESISNFNDNNICFKKNLILDNDIYLNLLLYIYKNNNIFYPYFHKKIKLLLKNYDSDFQIIIFFDHTSNIEYIKNKIKLLQDNLKAFINIIHFNNEYYDELEKYNINYIFLNNANLDEKYKSNKSLAYNIVFQIFEKYLFSYHSIILYDSMSNINSKIINNYVINTNNIYFNNNLDIIIIKDKIFDKIGYFDPEIFFENSKYEIIYFLEKIKKLYLENIDVNNITINNIDNIKINETKEYLYSNFYNNINNIIKNNNNKNIILNFLKNKYLIDYHIFNKIKVVIINLEERTDRLKNIVEECNKINISNYDIFKGIKINDENQYLNYNHLLNKNKMWKKDNIEYFNSALGCKISHLEVLKKYKDMNYEYLLILEDDAIFEETIIIYLNLALLSLKKKNWDILFLASNLKEKNDALKIDHNLLKINKGLTTTAQIFSKNNIKNIIEVIENSDLEIDNTYNDFLKEKYCIYPMCVYQKESYSDINKQIINYGNFHKKFKY